MLPVANPNATGSGRRSNDGTASNRARSAAQSVQRRERQLHLGLQTSDPGYPTLTRLSADVLQQRSFVDSDVTAEDPHMALSFGKVVENASQALASSRTPPQSPRAGGGHLPQ
jgi:hypothetical protein